MANPRRNSYSNTHTHPTTSETTSQQQTHYLSFSYLIYFLKKPHAFPFLLSVFLLLTWVSLRLQVSSSSASQHPHHQHHQSQETQKLKRGYSYDIAEDKDANLVRFTSGFLSSRDKRGWLLNPVNAAHDAGISGGAVSCVSTHVGQIRPGAMRGNHRHYTCNETFVVWGAETKFRLENPKVAKGYAEVLIGAEEVAVVASPSGIAHALLNVDTVRTTFFLGCQDNVVTYNTSSTDFNVWKDL